MAESFDPYYKWLGIAPQEQPPNHYRLLAINLFEADPDVIEAAADRQMSHLRSYQTGPHSAESQKLLNECATARVALLDLQKKAEYDGQLRGKLGHGAVFLEDGPSEGMLPGSLPRAELLGVPPNPSTNPAPLFDATPPSPIGRFASRRRTKNSGWLIPAAAAGGAVALALVLWVALRPSGPSDPKNRQPKTIAASSPTATAPRYSRPA